MARSDVKKGNTGETAVCLREQAKAAGLVVHFVGIGGCGMSALAQMLHRAGHTVTGSDAVQSKVTDQLEAAGIRVHIGHDAGNVPAVPAPPLAAKAAMVVTSAAVKADNPELVEARRQGLNVWKYAQMLGRISAGYETIAIAGTHGKSTTSAWTAYALHEAGKKPNFVIGADVKQLGGGSGAGAGEHLVVEACEYDRSFLNLRPRSAAILNIERDHLDYYADLGEIVGAFEEFASLVDPDGLCVVNAADSQAMHAVRGSAATTVGCRVETFSATGPADWQAGSVTWEAGHAVCDVLRQGRSLGRVRFSLPGRHNLANGLAMAALAWEARLTEEQILHTLETFGGAGRRLTLKGEVGGITILDDYAHHPTEVRVTLEAVREKYAQRKVWCVFQPHQCSRTALLLEEFAGSFAAADIVLLADIYSVRDSEASRRAVDAEQVSRRIEAHGIETRAVGEFSRIVDVLRREAQPGDVIVTMGAGDIGKVADELLCRLG